MPTVLHRLAQWAEARPQMIAQRFKREGEWQSLTSREYCDRVYYLALFLRSRGMDSEQIGAIFAYNSAEWVHQDLATLLIGCKSAGIYPNSVAKEIHYILNHTGATALGVQNREYFERITAGGAVPDRVHTIITYDNDTSIHPRAIAYRDAILEGQRLAREPKAPRLTDLLEALNPKAPAFMIYTSGTTGNPKGAMLSHDNFCFTSDIVARYWKLPFERGSLFSFLPLCHVAEKLQNVAVGISQRYTVNFCTKFELVAQELVEVQPSLLLCVPRLWEKMVEGVENKLRLAPKPRRALAHWALEVGKRVAAAKFEGREPELLDQIQHRVAEKLVLAKVRHALGLAGAELLASGAAALPAHVSRWFHQLGLEILEDFGQTESTGVITMTEPHTDSAGTVGKPLPGIEVSLAEDGEVLTRGRHVFVGYFNDEASTQAALEGGWLHTGDLGEWTAEGRLRIRGRKKDIMKSSGGKMVAPLPIEERIKVCPIVSQVCMVGDGRKYFAALVTLSEGKLAELRERSPLSLQSQTVTDTDVVHEIQKFLDGVNAELSGFEQIKRFAVLPREFSIADGEMTPTMKMKRNVIETRYRELINQLY